MCQPAPPYIVANSVHAEQVTCCCWVDNTAFVTGGEDGLVVMWHAGTGEAAARMIGHTNGVLAVSIANLGKAGLRVVSCSQDKTVRLWKVTGDMGRTHSVLNAHTDFVTGSGFAQQTQELITVGCDRVVCVWDLGKAVQA